MIGFRLQNMGWADVIESTTLMVIVSSSIAFRASDAPSRPGSFTDPLLASAASEEFAAACASV